MRADSGVTLVELMIGVVLFGLLAMTLGDSIAATHRVGLDELRGERALQLLEYEAECVSTGKTVDPRVEAALKEGLLDPRVVLSRTQATATVTVEWRRSTGGTLQRSVTVFVKGHR